MRFRIIATVLICVAIIAGGVVFYLQKKEAKRPWNAALQAWQESGFPISPVPYELSSEPLFRDDTSGLDPAENVLEQQSVQAFMKSEAENAAKAPSRTTIISDLLSTIESNPLQKHISTLRGMINDPSVSNEKKRELFREFKTKITELKEFTLKEVDAIESRHHDLFYGVEILSSSLANRSVSWVSESISYENVNHLFSYLSACERLATLLQDRERVESVTSLKIELLNSFVRFWERHPTFGSYAEFQWVVLRYDKEFSRKSSNESSFLKIHLSKEQAARFISHQIGVNWMRVKSTKSAEDWKILSRILGFDSPPTKDDYLDVLGTILLAYHQALFSRESGSSPIGRINQTTYELMKRPDFPDSLEFEQKNLVTFRPEVYQNPAIRGPIKD